MILICNINLFLYFHFVISFSSKYFSLLPKSIYITCKIITKQDEKKDNSEFIHIFFIVGLVIGFLLPFHLSDLTKKIAGNKLKPNVFDVPKRLGQLDLETAYFKYTVLAEAETGAVELVRVDDKIPLHIHPNENHFVYILKGHAKGTVGAVTAEVGPGQLVAIPAGVPHSFERVGDSPVEILLFSTPPFKPNDTMWMDRK